MSEQWRQTQLGKVCEIILGQSPSSDTYNQERIGLPFFQGKSEFSSKYAQAKTWCSDPLKVAKKEDVLISVRAPVGESNLAPENCCIGRGLAALRADQEYLLQDFLWHQINFKKGCLQGISQGSTFDAISGKDISELEVEVPPLPEQKKIAEILSGIDNLIAITKSRMISEQHLRAGLLKEMISEDGAFLKLDSVSTRVSGHTPSKSNPEYWDGGIPWISLSDTAKLNRRYISDTAKEISAEGIQNSSAVLHPAGLVVLSRDARVGCSAITTKKMAVSQHFIGWICSEHLHNRYLYYVLQKWKGKFEGIAMGSTIPTIGVPYFRDLEIPVPPVSEQRKIADTIESVDRHIAELMQRIYCLQNLKSAVASDLLSGRKRVSV